MYIAEDIENCSYIPRSEHNTFNRHKRWNDSGFRLLLSEVLQYALLCGNRLPMFFYPWNMNIYLLKCVKQRRPWNSLLSLELHQHCHCPASLTTVWTYACTHTSTHAHTALIKRSNPVLVTINYSNHRSHIHMKWITVKIIVSLPKALQRRSTL